MQRDRLDVGDLSKQFNSELEKEKMFYVGYLFSHFKLKTNLDLNLLNKIINELYEMGMSCQQRNCVLQQVLQTVPLHFDLQQMSVKLKEIIHRMRSFQSFNQFGEMNRNKFRELDHRTRKLSTKECTICFQSIDIKQLMVLGCSHPFHKDCVRKTIQARIDASQCVIRCPENSCQKQIIKTSIDQILNPQYRQKYQKLTFLKLVQRNFSSMCWCPTIGCKYVFYFEPGQLRLTCPLCLKTYCLSCKVEFHNNLTCDQYNRQKKISQHDEIFYEFASGAHYKQCPRCKYWVEKSQGCDHMTCRCKFQFCYICGQSYDSCGCNVEQQAQRAELALMIASQQLREIGQALRERQQHLQNLQMLEMLTRGEQIRQMGTNILIQGWKLVNQFQIQSEQHLKDTQIIDITNKHTDSDFDDSQFPKKKFQQDFSNTSNPINIQSNSKMQINEGSRKIFKPFVSKQPKPEDYHNPQQRFLAENTKKYSFKKNSKPTFSQI